MNARRALIVDPQVTPKRKHMTLLERVTPQGCMSCAYRSGETAEYGTRCSLKAAGIRSPAPKPGDGGRSCKRYEKPR